jgi:ubiquinone/menaquinone biosynthesis C-methylase UbiE
VQQEDAKIRERGNGANEGDAKAGVSSRGGQISCDAAAATDKQQRQNQPPGTVMERNVEVFNADTAAHGGYVYTAIDRWSSRHATGRQTEELVRMLAKNFSPSDHVVDIGCGDGTFTLEIAERFGPAAIRGIDPAGNAVDAARARIPSRLSGLVSFEVGSIYDVENKGETVAVVRGVLHHLDRPKAAIAQLTKQFSSLIVLEPNGYNPVMKIIEKASQYHRQHDERSYWPPTLNRWFTEAGFSVMTQKFFGLVPYFCPTPAARILARAESAIESLPVVRQICCGTNLALYGRLPCPSSRRA